MSDNRDYRTFLAQSSISHHSSSSLTLSIQLQTVEVDSTWDLLPILALSIPVNGFLSTAINAHFLKPYFHPSDEFFYPT